jgi:hypothetical protein
MIHKNSLLLIIVATLILSQTVNPQKLQDPNQAKSISKVSSITTLDKIVSLELKYLAIYK